MSLSEKLAAPPAPVTRKTTLDAWVANLPPKDRTAVEAALADPAWRHKDLQQVLTEEGMPRIADTTFGQWRRESWLNR